MSRAQAAHEAVRLGIVAARSADSVLNAESEAIGGASRELLWSDVDGPLPMKALEPGRIGRIQR